MGIFSRYPHLKTAWNATKVLVALLSFASFLIGVLNKSHLITDVDGFDGVFTVVGGILIFLFVFPLYGAIRNFFPAMPSSDYLALGLRVLFMILFTLQSSLLVVYLGRYLGGLYYCFLIPDLLLFFVQVRSTKWTRLWASAYTLLLVIKLLVFWPILSDAAYLEKEEALGPNGFLVTLLFTIPIVQFPVTLSFVLEGMNVYEAYTANMSAAFAHTLHVLDCMSTYLLGTQKAKFQTDVQAMLLMLSLMGVACTNVYYILLFFRSEADAARGAVVTNRHAAGPTSGLQLAALQSGGKGKAEQSQQDEDLLHYIVWCVFFVDLPYFVLRVVAFFVQGTPLSVFVAKNVMMMVCAVQMVLKHHNASASIS